MKDLVLYLSRSLMYREAANLAGRGISLITTHLSPTIQYSTYIFASLAFTHLQGLKKQLDFHSESDGYPHLRSLGISLN